jgi:hypothetical protein
LSGKLVPVGDVTDSLHDVVEGTHSLMNHEFVFAGLNLPRGEAALEAARRSQQLLPYSGRSYTAVPSRYRDAVISPAEALAIGDRDLERRSAEHPGVSFEPTTRRLGMEHPMFYVFLRVGREWREEGGIPGALICCVDRNDGHVWSDEEFAERP